MTPKQMKVLQFILGFMEQNGYQPSQMEIAQGCGFESLGTVQHYLKVLEREGHLSRQWNARRGLQLNVTEVAPQTPPEARMELPLVGIVAAGRPVEAYQMADAIEVPSAMAGPGNVVYEVRGDSMVEMGIMDGDYVAVHPQAVAENGQTVIAEVNGSITIKKYVRKGRGIELHPANTALQPIMVTEEDEFIYGECWYKPWGSKLHILQSRCRGRLHKVRNTARSLCLRFLLIGGFDLCTTEPVTGQRGWYNQDMRTETDLNALATLRNRHRGAAPPPTHPRSSGKLTSPVAPTFDKPILAASTCGNWARPTQSGNHPPLPSPPPPGLRAEALRPAKAGEGT